MSGVRVVGPLDAGFPWDGSRLCEPAELSLGAEPPETLRGAAALVRVGGTAGGWRILRDPLGIGKLFWASEPDGRLALAARPWRLVEEGHELDAISAVPRGLVLDLDDTGAELRASSLVPAAWSEPQADADERRAGSRIRDLVDRYLAALAARHGRAPTFVCLSGGLDSSVVAALAAQHFDDSVVVSF